MSNSVDPDEMAHYEPSHLDLCCLQKLIIITCGSERVKVYYALRIDPLSFGIICRLFVLSFHGPVNPMGSCRAPSVYLTTRLLGRLSPLSG